MIVPLPSDAAEAAPTSLAATVALASEPLPATSPPDNALVVLRGASLAIDSTDRSLAMLTLPVTAADVEVFECELAIAEPTPTNPPDVAPPTATGTAWLTAETVIPPAADSVPPAVATVEPKCSAVA